MVQRSLYVFPDTGIADHPDVYTAVLFLVASLACPFDLLEQTPEQKAEWFDMAQHTLSPYEMCSTAARRSLAALPVLQDAILQASESLAPVANVVEAVSVSEGGFRLNNQERAAFWDMVWLQTVPSDW